MTTPAPNCSKSLRDAALGLSQQMVWWGYDVRHPEGNALVRFGMSRRPSPGLTGTSCYSIAWENGLLELHGAVASWTSPPGGTGCVFNRDLKRIDLWHGSKAPVPGQQFGESGGMDERWRAAAPLIRWLTIYEKWVLRTLGEEWRGNCWKTVRRLPKGKQWLPPSLALIWWEEAISSAVPLPDDLLKF